MPLFQSLSVSHPATSMVTRRQLLQSAWLAGTWSLGLAQASSVAPNPGAPSPGFSPWLRFEADGSLTVLSAVADLGQGTWALLRALAAHQAALPIDRVHMQSAPMTARHMNPVLSTHATFGSAGHLFGLRVLREACAAARTMLCEAAAQGFGVPADACEARDGRVHHQPTGRSVAYADLLTAASTLSPPAQPSLLPGTPKVQRDASAGLRVRGRLAYGLDAAPADAWRAAMMSAPALGVRPLAVRNESVIRAMPGVQGVVLLPKGVAVVALSTWQAFQAVAALQVDWDEAARSRTSSAALDAQLRAAAMKGAGRNLGTSRDAAFNVERTAAALAEAAQVVDVQFSVPFLAHLPMEPLNACVRVEAQAAQVWTATQNPFDTQREVAAALGLLPSQVQMECQVAGGGFGRRLEFDWVLDAARVAQAFPGKAVQLVWRRENELAAAYFRPASAARVRVALNAQGLVTGLRADVAQPSLLQSSGLTNGPPPTFDWTATMGWHRQNYRIPAIQLTCTTIDAQVPCTYWRSVGASQNQFFFEVALDLAAKQAGVSPLALRKQLTAGHARTSQFLVALADLGHWDLPLEPQHARGIAIGTANGTISGHVVELHVPEPGKFRIVRIAGLIDAGQVFDESAVQGQMEGGTLFGLSAALWGEASLQDGAVMQSNFHDQRVARMGDVPEMQVRVWPSSAPPGGVGEEGVPTIAPAIANALFAASGKPTTQLPLTRAGWEVLAPRG